MNMDVSELSGSSIRIRFSTKLPEFVIPDDPLSVGLEYGVIQLNEIVGHILGLSEPQTFQFVIQEKLLHGSIGSFLKANEISQESVIELECIKPSDIDKSLTQDCNSFAWIGCLVQPLNLSYIIAGCYDGQLRAFHHNKDGSAIEIVSSTPISSFPLRCISTTQSEDSKHTILVGGKDHSISSSIFLEPQASKKRKRLTHPTFEPASIVHTHDVSVESLSSSTQDQFVFGDYSGGISMSSSSDVSFMQPHTLSVSSLCLLSSSHCVSCSFDRHVKTIDLVRKEVTWSSSLSCCPFTDCCVSTSSSWIAACSTIGTISVYDPRAKGSPQLIISSNVEEESRISQWMSKLKRISDFCVVSGDYFGCVKIWDMRSASEPITSVAAHSGKILAMCVSSDEKFVYSGGSDCRLVANGIV